MRIYPYYIVPVVEEYHKLDPDSEEAKRLARFIAVNVGDAETLRQLLGMNPPEVLGLSGENEIISPSFDAIDSFLDKFKDKAEILPPGVLTIGENTPEEKDLQFIENKPIPNHEGELKNLLTQHRYDEAIMLIEQQNLNNPQKSIYFAHQIRFIRKLMAIDKYKNLTQG